MIVLDWSDLRHWSGRTRPCRVCGLGTALRDDAGRVAHKVCVEAELSNLVPASTTDLLEAS